MPRFVIAYDIHEDRRREWVARVLLSYGERVQQSVFVAWLDEAEHAELRRRLGTLLRRQDQLEIFPIDGRLAERQVSWQNEPLRYQTVRVIG